MTETAQHGLHPDAECLNAFAEHALGEGERDGVLRHLAGCSRCRQVVALAQRAVESEVFEKVAAAAAPRPAVQPNAWWKRWRLIWAPAAVAATLAVTSVSFYLRQTEQRNSAIRIAEQSPKNGSAQASSPPPTELAESASLASPAPAAPAAKTPRARESEATPSLRQRQREGPVLAGKPQSLNQLAPPPPATAQSLPPQGNLAPRLTFEGFTSKESRPSTSRLHLWHCRRKRRSRTSKSSRRKPTHCAAVCSPRVRHERQVGKAPETVHPETPVTRLQSQLSVLGCVPHQPRASGCSASSNLTYCRPRAPRVPSIYQVVCGPFRLRTRAVAASLSIKPAHSFSAGMRGGPGNACLCSGPAVPSWCVERQTAPFNFHCSPPRPPAINPRPSRLSRLSSLKL